MSVSPMARWVLWIVLGIGIGLAALLIWFRFSVTSIDGFYTVTDSLIDPRRNEITNVLFVEVPQYDSVRILRSVKEITLQHLSDTAMKKERDRLLLFHFYVPSDTGALTDEMLEELTYTHPEIADPRSMLRLIRGGYIVKVRYPAKAVEPSDIMMFRSQFYLTQPGIKAKDLR